MKKRVIVSGIVIVALLFATLILYSNRVIGKLSGSENEKVILDDGVSYVICDDYHTHKDKGWILGKIAGAYGTSYYVFSVRGDATEEYIYVASMGRGAFYKRIN